MFNQQIISGGVYKGGRKHLISGDSADPNAVIQITTKDIEFQTAFFYGFKNVPDDGADPTVNADTVYIGEKDGTGTYCIDPVEAALGTPTMVQAPVGRTLNLKDFWVRLPQPGDKVFVKYQ
jgi:hypothetical protein